MFDARLKTGNLHRSRKQGSQRWEGSLNARREKTRGRVARERERERRSPHLRGRRERERRNGFGGVTLASEGPRSEEPHRRARKRRDSPTPARERASSCAQSLVTLGNGRALKKGNDRRHERRRPRERRREDHRARERADSQRARLGPQQDEQVRLGSQPHTHTHQREAAFARSPRFVAPPPPPPPPPRPPARPC